MAPHHALVFGASGILGWAVVDQILKNYPERGVFGRVTALCHRPLTEASAYWARPGPTDTPRLQIIDGIELTRGTPEEMREVLRQRVPDIASVTHIYYFAYISDFDFPKESEINLGMLRRGFGAAESLAAELQYVVFPSGTKKYGIHAGWPFSAPFKEEMADIHQPWHDDLFYYVLHEELDKMQQGKGWQFAEVCCGPVVGFVPHQNPYNLPLIFMDFLSLYRFMHEQGHPAAAAAEIPLPAPPGSYDTLFHDGDQGMVARFSIYLTLHPAAAGNSRLYNIGASDEPASMADRWPHLCAQYGLTGTPPVAKTDPQFRLPVGFVAEHADMAERLERERGVSLQGVFVAYDRFLEGFMEYMTADHHQSMERARATGFADQVSSRQSWEAALERYVAAKRAYRGA